MKKKKFKVKISFIDSYVIEIKFKLEKHYVQGKLGLNVGKLLQVHL